MPRCPYPWVLPVVDAELKARLLEVVRREFHPAATIENLNTLTGGAASSTMSFELLLETKRKPCIFRRAGGSGEFTVGVSKTLEAQVQQACFQAGVPVAEVLYILASEDRLGEGYIMGWLPGESIPQKTLRKSEFDAIRPQLAQQCGELAARIHRVSPPEMLSPITIADQLAGLEQQYHSYSQPLPAFDLAFRWLHKQMPAETQPALVHGDFRNGNFLVTPEEGITGVLDWELCHVGDPMEDLGWLCVNSWRFGYRDFPVGGFGRRDDLFAAYERAGGQQVDPVRVHFWEMLGTLKWGVMCIHMTLGSVGRGTGDDGDTRPTTSVSLERAAIGRRISEVEVDLLVMLAETGQ